MRVVCNVDIVLSTTVWVSNAKCYENLNAIIFVSEFFFEKKTISIYVVEQPSHLEENATFNSKTTEIELPSRSQLVSDYLLRNGL